MTRTKEIVLIVVAALLVALGGVLVATAPADGADKVTICHAAGRAGTTKYVTLTISENAVYKEQGGHFFENGTPRAGHEDDYLGPCLTVDPTDPTTEPTEPTTEPTEPTTEPTQPTTPTEPVDKPEVPEVDSPENKDEAPAPANSPEPAAVPTAVAAGL
jgi:hypothetical protein